MAQPGQIFPLASIDGTHFTDALAQHASEVEILDLPAAVGTGGGGRCRIQNCIVWSSDNLIWEIGIYQHKDPKSPDPNVDYFVGRISLPLALGLQDDAAGLYRYYLDGLDILYEDAMQLGRIYLTVVNRSAGAKTAYGVGGHFRLRLGLSPTMGW